MWPGPEMWGEDTVPAKNMNTAGFYLLLLDLLIVT